MRIPEIKKILKSEFQLALFESALKNLIEPENKLRYNNFAYAIRELSRHFLHSLAPDDKIESCEWFELEEDQTRPTRAQRIKYSIQGGLSENLLSKIGINPEDTLRVIKKTKETISSLSKYTHINPEVFDIPKKEVASKSKEVLDVFADFANTIVEHRNNLKLTLRNTIDSQVLTKLIFNHIEDLAPLAPTHIVKYAVLGDYRVNEVNCSEIKVEFIGELMTTLEYGSKEERKRDDGLDLNVSFPFSGMINYAIVDTFPLEEFEFEFLEVNTDSWYE
ncbi:hypothetical protein [Gilvibacter sediminis]|uniref:pPIWI-associating nuclease domain-containing protein n=1 Tax=Gilvibacter sediminis TaxID=379071 RepID=UPI00234FC693|nr:hypothetical protein [Gilvibacter sediminis]MDC7997378.1 hypothetical protein [Gilvibacter sediminis]